MSAVYGNIKSEIVKFNNCRNMYINDEFTNFKTNSIMNRI